ncbi:MAG: endo-1,4-beta-xylanase [Spirochaetales bacterium]|nr:endo-1,4-beta-xylanase [Spirochaetales bacterium]
MKNKVLLFGIAVVMCTLLQYGSALDFIGNVFGNDKVPDNFASYWNQVTPENGGKWGSVETKQDEYSWGWCDAAYNYCKSNGIPFKQHTFVWGNQEPSWIASLSNSEKMAEVEEWIKDYGQRYPNTDYIDVVNEPLHDPPSYQDALGGSGSTGWDWVVWTFEKARQYCPKAKLLINDYGIISDPGAANNYLNIINILLNKGLIDGIGIQCHSFNMDGASTNTMTQVLDALGATGLPIYASELDITGDDNTQLQRYQEKFPVLADHPSVKGITFWGYIQGSTWEEEAYLITESGSERPALTWLKNNYLLRTNATPAPAETPIPTEVPTPTPAPQNAYNTVEAELYVEMDGIMVESCDEGGEGVGYIEDGDYTAYLIDFTDGASEMQVRAASENSGGTVEVRLDSPTGELLGTININGTGGWQSWQTFSGSVQDVNGQQLVYMVYTGGDSYLFNVNWFNFTPGNGVTAQPTNVTTPAPGETPGPTSASTSPPAGGDCTNVPVWTASDIYANEGTRVQYNGNLYENKWYSQDQNPEQNSGEYDVWIYLGPCDSGITPDPTPAPTAVNETPAPTSPPGNLGDTNSDGTIDIVDALLLAQYYVDLNPQNFTAANADTNCDGAIDIVDALLIAQYYVQLITRFC